MGGGKAVTQACLSGPDARVTAMLRSDRMVKDELSAIGAFGGGSVGVEGHCSGSAYYMGL